MLMGREHTKRWIGSHLKEGTFQIRDKEYVLMILEEKRKKENWTQHT